MIITPKDLRLNLYNDKVLKAWRANIDIQYVLDPYACAMYIVSYISKSQRGMSALLYAAAKEAILRIKQYAEEQGEDPDTKILDAQSKITLSQM